MVSASNVDGHYEQDKNKADSNAGLYVWTNERLKIATQAVNGQWVSGDDNFTHTPISATRIITDTRKLQSGDIFLAIIGDNFDGHQFIAAAAEKGAIAAIVSRPIVDVDIPQLQVTDTRLAFGEIAAYRRQQHNNLKVIAITGSSGKTTVKEMLRSIFMQVEVVATGQADNQDYSSRPEAKRSEIKQSETQSRLTLVTRGNLNNDYGVPMMLLELADYHQYAVLELGANHVGEIAYTTNIVKPDVACILNIGTAHLGEFGGRDNIAKTKAEIYKSLTAGNTAVVPFNDDYTEQLTAAAKKYTNNVIHFGCQQLDGISSFSPEIYATDVVTTALESSFALCFARSNNEVSLDAEIALPVTLPMAGKHNVSNALAAAACAYAAGIDPQVIATGLSHAKSTKGRLGRQALGMHQIIDDTYNANPSSMRAAADVLAAQEGMKILVLGDIGELGDAVVEEHTKLGHAIADKDIDMLLCVGEFAENTVKGALSQGMQDAYSFATKAELLAKLKTVLTAQSAGSQKCTVLFKGSRSATMETLIDDLVKYKEAFD